MTRVLAIDLGTSSVKVQVTDDDGQLHGGAARPYPTARPRLGYAEQDPDDWWRATSDAVRDALISNGGAGDRITAIGITGQMHGTVVVDDDLRPLAPAIIWSDQRSSSAVSALEESIGPARVNGITGGRLATGYQAATLSWLGAHQPDLLVRGRAILLPKDWLRMRLTCEIATDPSDASGTGLFDISLRDWSPTMTQAVGLQPERLPPILPSVERAGTLTQTTAVALGLPAGIPVAVGAGDAQAAALGAGVTRSGDLLVTLSTGTQALLPVDTIPGDQDHRGQTVSTAIDPGVGAGWARVAATLNTGSALHWAARTLGFTDDREVLAAAAGVPTGANGVLFVPYLGGERSPWFDATARGSFIGLGAGQTREDLARAVVEGITLAGSLAFDAIAGDGDRYPAAITLAGGGANDPSWRQLVADVYGLPVRYHATPDQSARGAAILATAMLHGANPVDVADGWQPTTMDELTPHTVRHELYRNRQRSLGEAYLALRPIVAGLGNEQQT
jgi:xylulokinase